jgi:hypothetical protein
LRAGFFGTSRNAPPSIRGSLGIPNTRSEIIFRWISSVPPAIDVAGTDSNTSAITPFVAPSDPFSNASVNAGTSFLAHDDPDYTFKVGMSFNFGGSKSKSNASNFNADFTRELALVEQRNLSTDNKQAEAIKNVQKDNREMKRDNLTLQAKVNAMRSDKEELLAMRAEVDGLKTDKAEMLALRTANEKLQAQMDRINDLLIGAELVAEK